MDSNSLLSYPTIEAEPEGEQQLPPDLSLLLNSIAGVQHISVPVNAILPYLFYFIFNSLFLHAIVYNQNYLNYQG
jgi:hypothetical protein